MGVVVISGRRFDTRAIKQLLIHTVLMGALPIMSYYAGRNFYLENLPHLGWDPEFFAAGVAICVVQIVIGRFIYVAVTEQDEPEDLQEKQEREKVVMSNEKGGTEDVHTEENGVEGKEEEVEKVKGDGELESNGQTVDSKPKEQEVGEVSAARVRDVEKKTQ
eukprot:comp12840_c1_seq1/m.8000 comp12840_c1_seq1/g.8000  ORF comp12840_c1_seq1/g.8000 comp12840_c1_seq1/m.8000 type:complete len:162 (-) comp12840_c1_seq1:156-641(-)